MSARDLIIQWEEALAVALSQPDDEDPITEMHDGDLTNVADRRIARIRSNVLAGCTHGTDVCYVPASAFCSQPNICGHTLNLPYKC